jgi:long-chain acyl-CoA synthetase
MIPFWDEFSDRGDLTALVDANSGVSLSYRMLADKLVDISSSLDCSTKRLILLPLSNRIDDVVFYLGALASQHAVAMYDPQIDDSERQKFVDSFQPDLVIEQEELANQDRFFMHNLRQRIGRMEGGNVRERIHAELKLLLSTSGSTGYRKFVRLSKTNISSNASQIVSALKIGVCDRAITNLPLTYVYGLSVLHSHLSAGACVIVGEYSLFDSRLWKLSAEYGITNFYGVPWTFQNLRSLISGERRLFPATLRSLSVAGGKLDSETAAWLRSAFGSTEIYFMYGQTEAAGRIAVLPSELTHIKVGSAGLPVPGGKILITANGEVRYTGPNVMLGYASSAHDLMLGDQLHGLLETGDTGYLDDQGFLFLTGRCSRIAKLFGLRFDLDEVQDCFRDITPVVVQKRAEEEKFVITFADDNITIIEGRVRELCSRWHLPKAAWELRRVDALKRLPSGKLALMQIEE